MASERISTSRSAFFPTLQINIDSFNYKLTDLLVNNDYARNIDKEED